MQTTPVNPLFTGEPTSRTRELLLDHQDRIRSETSRLFAILMVIQWLAGIAVTAWISPRTWVGTSSYIHLHVWLAIFLGGRSRACRSFWRSRDPLRPVRATR